MHPRWLVSVLYHGRACTGTRISTGYPSTTPVGLALGPDSPWEDELDPGTLSHPAVRILTLQFVTHACILTRVASTARSPCRFHGHTTLPYPSTHLPNTPQSEGGLLRECRSFGGVLEPRYIVGAGSLDQ